MRIGAEIVAAIKQTAGKQVHVEIRDQEALVADAAGDPMLIDHGHACRLEELTWAWATGNPSRLYLTL